MTEDLVRHAARDRDQDPPGDARATAEWYGFCRVNQRDRTTGVPVVATVRCMGDRQLDPEQLQGATTAPTYTR